MSKHNICQDGVMNDFVTKVNVKEDLSNKLIVTEGFNPLKQDKKPITRKEIIMSRKPPAFLLPENRLDKNQKRPTDPEYDPTSILISAQEYRDLTDGMKRYWDIKRNNMEKIIFWRFGTFYVVYYDDLTICGKFLDMAITPTPCP